LIPGSLYFEGKGRGGEGRNGERKLKGREEERKGGRGRGEGSVPLPFAGAPSVVYGWRRGWRRLDVRSISTVCTV